MRTLPGISPERPPRMNAANYSFRNFTNKASKGFYTIFLFKYLQLFTSSRYRSWIQRQMSGKTIELFQTFVFGSSMIFHRNSSTIPSESLSEFLPGFSTLIPKKISPGNIQWIQWIQSAFTPNNPP